ncbi:MAG: hypothetical protein H6830_03815 [Planctomycetes bacterium]|nr:hypothetical protein [Planctomycetota bacterium]HPF15365.1 hypothetical protein [Planctomycetota bacterium]
MRTWLLLLTLPLGPMALSQTPEPTPTPPAPEIEAPKTEPDGPFRSIPLREAYDEAAKTKKLSVVVYLQPNDEASEEFLADMLADKALCEWLRVETVAIQQWADRDREELQRRGITKFPGVEMRAADMRVLDSIEGRVPAAELLTLLKAAKRSESANEKPTGVAAEDPYSWMAYGNNLQGRGGDPVEVADAYFWCLDHGNRADPEFLAQNLDFLLRRLIFLKKFQTEIETNLRMRRDAVHRQVVAGKAKDFDAYMLVRMDQYLRDIDDPVRAFRNLKSEDPRKQSLRQVILWNDLESLVAFRHYPDVLDCVPDPKAAMAARIVAIEASKKGLAPAPSSQDMPRPPGVGPAKELAGNTDPAKSEDGIPKVAPERPIPGVRLVPDAMSLDGAFLYECLLAEKRLDDAKALMEMVTDYVPTGKAYSYFVERANRLEKYDVAIDVAKRGFERVPEGDVARIQATLKRGMRKH